MPAGRPSKIDDVIRHRRVEGGGTVAITVFDAIVEAMRIGDYVESAAAAAGITKQSVYEWRRIGADLTARQHRAQQRGERPPTGTKHERRCQQFADAIAQATEEWHLTAIGTMEQLARGGRTVTKVTVKTDAGGTVTEQSTTTETLAPSLRALEWRLAHRFPERYGHRVAVELSGDVELSIDERAERLGSQLDAYLQGRADAASDETPTQAISRPAKGRRGGTARDTKTGAETTSPGA